MSVLTSLGSTRMLAAARELLAKTTDSAYSHVAEIAPERGYFRADCSELVDWLAVKARADALKQVPTDAGRAEPRARNLFDFFKSRPLVGTRHEAWVQPTRPAQLAPGDVVVWRNEAYVPGKSDTGHVMLVSELPKPVKASGRVVGYDVPIIDSTSHGHGPGDPRAKEARTGLGEGTVFIPVGDAGQATGFSWTPAGAAGDPPRPPSLAFGRLM